jgi:hypothetical protein
LAEPEVAVEDVVTETELVIQHQKPVVELQPLVKEIEVVAAPNLELTAAVAVVVLAKSVVLLPRALEVQAVMAYHLASAE